MFLRCKVRRKDGKQHRYWSVVENTRVGGGRVVQRHVLYLGEINDTRGLAGGGGVARTRGSAGGAWCSGTCCTWARSTTRRSWRGGGRSRFCRTAQRNPAR